MRSLCWTLLAMLTLAACGPSREEPPPRSPIKQQLDAQRRSIDAAQQEVRAAQERMNAEAAAAAGTAPDTAQL